MHLHAVHGPLAVGSGDDGLARLVVQDRPGDLVVLLGVGEREAVVDGHVAQMHVADLVLRDPAQFHGRDVLVGRDRRLSRRGGFLLRVGGLLRRDGLLNGLGAFDRQLALFLNFLRGKRFRRHRVGLRGRRIGRGRPGGRFGLGFRRRFRLRLGGGLRCLLLTAHEVGAVLLQCGAFGRELGFHLFQTGAFGGDFLGRGQFARFGRRDRVLDRRRGLFDLGGDVRQRHVRHRLRVGIRCRHDQACRQKTGETQSIRHVVTSPHG